MKNLLFNYNKILSRGRYPWVDYARGICIILVCYRHVFEGLGNVGEGSYNFPLLGYLNVFFFSFRMPLFFIVSGIFLAGSLSRNGTNNYLVNRVHNIFYPLLIWGSIQITLQLIFAEYVNARREPIDYLNLIVEPRKIEQFWYLNALFFVSVLYALTRVYAKLKSWHQLIVGAILFIVATYSNVNQIHLGFLSDVFFFYLFFAIGDNINDFILNTRNYKIFASLRTFLFLLPVFALLQHYFTVINKQHQDDYYVQYNEPWLYVLAALVGGAFVLNVSFILQKFNVLKFLRVIGYHSLHIFVMHLIVTAATRVFFVKLLHVYNIPFLMVISIVLGTLVPIIFYNIINRMGGWWLFTLRKPEAVKKNHLVKLYNTSGLVTPKESEQKPKNEMAE